MQELELAPLRWLLNIQLVADFVCKNCKALVYFTPKVAAEMSAVAVIQTHYRRHFYTSPRTLGVNIFHAAILRRSILCIQRGWRWSLLRRRFVFLAALRRYLGGVDSSTLQGVENALNAASHEKCQRRISTGARNSFAAAPENEDTKSIM